MQFVFIIRSVTQQHIIGQSYMIYMHIDFVTKDILCPYQFYTF